MPRRRGSVELTDAQTWVLVSADPSVTDRQLADALGVAATTVHAARWRLRRHGWTCAVSYPTCRACGHPLTRQGRRQGRRAYHPACKPEGRRAVQHTLDSQRWDRLTLAERTEALARAHAADVAHQRETLATAERRGARWTADEDAELIERQGEPAHVVARDLGRTLRGTRTRRALLRRRGRLRPRGPLP